MIYDDGRLAVQFLIYMTPYTLATVCVALCVETDKASSQSILFLYLNARHFAGGFEGLDDLVAVSTVRNGD